ncbi:carboxypeptidase-like regulatory domain-containing protein [Bremerella sp. T1]|uniref:carboxypeptidase-like regulatory domain-containing protein n=1 Tax=Bremerella sp. TYQ1 TaxID=3119568 RepID=UPI001CCE0B00|nr:carboxypeptidase-like regulatory domain-containing protein [Bremerella volcania]UBM34397.1 carboxypeptidase-like regulatory domain-containing protein [Bremerella volcania]
MSSLQSFSAAMLLAFAATSLGCFSSSSVDLLETTGTVTKDGVPLVKARLEFLPVNGNGATSQGITDENGNFKLYYSTGKLGAVPGPHKVTVQDGFKSGSKDPHAASQKDPTKAPPAPKEQSGQEILVTIEPGQENHIEIEL